MNRSILRMALFASVSLATVCPTVATAQILLPPPGSGPVDEPTGWQGFGSEKPRWAGQGYESCVNPSDYKLVPDGAVGPWRRMEDDLFPRYVPDAPVSTCGIVGRVTPLKCIQVSSGSTVEMSKCDYPNDAYFNFSAENVNRTLTQVAPSYSFFSLEKSNLGACGYDQYEWEKQPNEFGVCGTAMVDVYARCVDKATRRPVYDESSCNPGLRPTGQEEVTSTAGCTYDYSVGALTMPPESCGAAQKTRAVTCQGGDGKIAGEGDCANFLARFSPFGQVVNYGEDPVESVFVYGMPSACAGLDGKALSDECELLTNEEAGARYLRPRSTIVFQDARSCQTETPPEYEWRTGAFAPVRDSVCGTNTRTATSSCFDKASNAQVDDALCDPAKKPLGSETFDDASGCATQTSSAICGDAPSQLDRSAFGSCVSRVGVGGADKQWSVNLTRAVTLADGSKAFCVTSNGPSFNGAAQPDRQICGDEENGLSYIAIEGTGVCASSNLPSCTPAPTPTPTPPPGPPKEFRLGTCNYTSGSSKYACGPRANYRPGPAAPYPHDICSGTILAGSETDFTEAYQTPNAGPNWNKAPNPIVNVPGAQCVVHWRSYGYSNQTQQGWETVYFSGPPTGVADGLFIGPKP